VAADMKSRTLTKTEHNGLKDMVDSDASNALSIELLNPKASQSRDDQANASYSEISDDDSPSHSTLSRESDRVIDERKSEIGKRKSKREAVQRKLTVMFFLLIIVFIISYIPPLVILILTYTIKDFNFIELSEAKAMIWIYGRHIVLLNHVINPLIYGYYDTKFRKQLILCFKRRIHMFR
jgi:hypothetical protein